MSYYFNALSTEQLLSAVKGESPPTGTFDGCPEWRITKPIGSVDYYVFEWGYPQEQPETILPWLWEHRVWIPSQLVQEAFLEYVWDAVNRRHCFRTFDAMGNARSILDEYVAKPIDRVYFSSVKIGTNYTKFRWSDGEKKVKFAVPSMLVVEAVAHTARHRKVPFEAPQEKDPPIEVVDMGPYRYGIYSKTGKPISLLGNMALNIDNIFAMLKRLR